MCFSVQIDQDALKVANRLKASVGKRYFEEFEAQKARDPKKHKEADKDGRIFPNVYAPVMTIEGSERLLRPMRYRIRPHGSNEEVPGKFNVYNARLDSLESRATWSQLFGRQHCILPFKNFFEWVSKDGKKKLINFSPTGKDLMWAPGLYDTWRSKDGAEVIHSFAIITTEPPPEVLEMGHDRCPVFLREDLIEDWCMPEHFKKKDFYSMLADLEPVKYGHAWVS